MIKVNFCTGSSFEGFQDDNGNMANGTYKYKDGTCYEGSFKNGLFHGYGTVTLHSSRFMMEAHFENGSCTEVIDMRFKDGLPFKFENWEAFTDDDRRYWMENQYGLSGVGDHFSATAKSQRVLPNDCYDTEEGAFDPHSGYIWSFKNHELVKKLRFVEDEERKWIVENCRRSSFDAEEFITHSAMKDIIENNLKAEKLLNCEGEQI